MRSNQKLLPILSLFGICLAAQEPQNETEALLDLLNTPVTVAGGASTRISDTPAIVSVLRGQDLRQMGVTNLYEALSLLPGVHLDETSYGYTSVTFRGNLQAHYNNKTLLLLNDHPMYETITGSYYLEQIPLAMVNRIEVMRGPASTVYGTNAFAGVIKIVTYEAADLAQDEVSVGAGSFQTRSGEVTGRASYGKSSIVFGANLESSAGYPYRVTGDEDGRSGVINYRDNFGTGMVSARVGDFSFDAGASHIIKDKFGLIPALVSSGERSLKGFFLTGGFGRKLTDRLEVKLSVYHDRIAKDEDLDWYPPVYALSEAGIGSPAEQTYTGQKTGVEGWATYLVTPTFNLTASAFYEGQSTSPYLFLDTLNGQPTSASAWLDSHQGWDRGGFLLANFGLGASMGGTAGLRYSENDVYGGKVTPSLGLVYTPTARISLKALYGSAYRNPNFFEKDVQTPNILDGDLNLLPERVNTYDLGLDYRITSSNGLRLNLFQTHSANLIDRTGTLPAGVAGNTAPTPRYANSPGQDLSGVEAEYRGSFAPGEQHFLNYSFLRGKETESEATVQFIPKHLANLGMVCPLARNWTLSPSLQLVGAKDGAKADGTPVHVGSYTLANLSVEYRVSRAFSIQVTGKNILDKAWAYPEYIRGLIATTPGGPGRALYGKLTWHF